MFNEDQKLGVEAKMHFRSLYPDKAPVAPSPAVFAGEGESPLLPSPGSPIGI